MTALHFNFPNLILLPDLCAELHGQMADINLKNIKTITFMDEECGRACLCMIIGIGVNRLRKALSLAPDLRVGKVNAGQRQAAYSVDAFLSVLYEGVAETLPNRFIRRGQSKDDPSFDVETDDVEELKDWLDHPGRGVAWQSIAPDSKRLTKYLPPGTVRDLYEDYQSTRQLFGAAAVSQL